MLFSAVRFYWKIATMIQQQELGWRHRQVSSGVRCTGLEKFMLWASSTLERTSKFLGFSTPSFWVAFEDLKWKRVSFFLNYCKCLPDLGRKARTSPACQKTMATYGILAYGSAVEHPVSCSPNCWALKILERWVIGDMGWGGAELEPSGLAKQAQYLWGPAASWHLVIRMNDHRSAATVKTLGLGHKYFGGVLS